MDRPAGYEPVSGGSNPSGCAIIYVHSIMDNARDF